MNDPAQNRLGFVRSLGLVDSSMIVGGSMIGSGIFIVSADIGRLTGSPGLLLTSWVVAGLLTVACALAYSELASMMPQAGGQYVFLREAYSPLWGFLYGWTLFLVIQTGTIAAVAVAFARFLGVLVPWVSPTRYVIAPLDVSGGYAVSLSTQQLVAVLLIVVLTLLNTRGLSVGKTVQNIFTSVKTASLFGLIVVGLTVGARSDVIRENFASFWTPRGVDPIVPDLAFVPTISAGDGFIGMVIATCVALVGSLFSSDAWNNLTFAAAEVRDPERTVPRALAIGTGGVVALYALANVAYLAVLPLGAIQHAPDDRVATLALQTMFGGVGATIMAVAVVIATFGCNNGLVLAGARVYWAMAQNGLFFAAVGRLNDRRVPAVALVLQGLWACLLVLPRTRLRDASGAPLLDAATGLERYGNLYSNLLDYVVFAVLIFYVLTIIGLFVLRRKRPDAPRPYRAFGFPVVPALYVLVTSFVMVVLAIYRTQTTWPGLCIVLTGLPAYFVWRKVSPAPRVGGEVPAETPRR